MEDIIHTLHSGIEAFVVPNITNTECKLRIIKFNAHVFLLLFITAENPDLFDFVVEKF